VSGRVLFFWEISEINSLKTAQLPLESKSRAISSINLASFDPMAAGVREMREAREEGEEGVGREGEERREEGERREGDYLSR
jgi:hypothetical protein